MRDSDFVALIQSVPVKFNQILPKNLLDVFPNCEFLDVIMQNLELDQLVSLRKKLFDSLLISDKLGSGRELFMRAGNESEVRRRRYRLNSNKHISQRLILISVLII